MIKIPNKREFQKIALIHSLDIDLKDFIKIYKKCTAEPYYFLVNDTTLSSDNSLKFRKNHLKEICNKIMTIDDHIEDENYNMILIEKLEIYQPYHQAKIISMNILLVKKYCHLIKSK